MAIIRYPGSKAKLAEQIMGYFPDNVHFPLINLERPVEYREPFFGAGAIGLILMAKFLNPKLCPVWLNDADPGIAALWTAIWKHPSDFCIRVGKFTPSADEFFRLKSLDGQLTGNVVEDGFRKLALHRMSVSGFGYKSGGPIGGKNQTNKQYNVGCRWTPSRIKKDAMTVHGNLRRFKNLRITCEDFRVVLADASPRCFVYLDPPYYEKGEQLYKHNMAEADHAELAGMLRSTLATWVLSYDDHPEVRNLYHWATFGIVHATYTNAISTGPTRPKNREVVVTPSHLREVPYG